ICDICVNLWFLLSFFLCVICGSPFRIPQGVFTAFFLVGIKKCGILGYRLRVLFSIRMGLKDA
ncbi:MAG: hypothetical protein P4L49_09875, partial [Desulfosporosinus sp.]|nr:hypothetical protein [Desulfosporosinus sp.]